MSIEHFPLQSASLFYGARMLRNQLQDEIAAGVIGFSDFKVQQRGAGANMSCDVAVGANGVAVAYVPYTFSGTSYGLRRVEMSALSNSGTPGSVNAADWIATFAAADPTNPRIDSVYIVCRDSTIDATGALDAKLQVVQGTAIAGATLDNRTNAGAAPANSILLADVLIPATAVTVTTANIRDRRSFGPVQAPGIFTAADEVPMIPVPGVQVSAAAAPATTAHQAAVLCQLPRRIVGATRIRWGYRQTATPTTGNYVFAICDASGRPIVNTGSVGYAGALNTNQQRSEVIAATTFEAGLYWVMFGHTLTAGAAVTSLCAQALATTNPVAAANLFAYSTSGGVAVPATILGYTDAGATPPAALEGVPVIALSVG
jgi:hypothetical protein